MAYGSYRMRTAEVYTILRLRWVLMGVGNPAGRTIMEPCLQDAAGNFSLLAFSSPSRVWFRSLQPTKFSALGQSKGSSSWAGGKLYNYEPGKSFDATFVMGQQERTRDSRRRSQDSCYPDGGRRLRSPLGTFILLVDSVRGSSRSGALISPNRSSVPRFMSDELG